MTKNIFLTAVIQAIRTTVNELEYFVYPVKETNAV